MSSVYHQLFEDREEVLRWSMDVDERLVVQVEGGTRHRLRFELRLHRGRLDRPFVRRARGFEHRELSFWKSHLNCIDTHGDGW